MKKRYKVIIILQSIVLFLLISLIGFGYLITDDGEYLRAEYDNVKIYEVGHPFLFGNSTVKVYYGDYIFEAKIANDGATLTDDNYAIIKNNDFYEVTFKGSEQNNVTYYLKLQEKITT